MEKAGAEGKLLPTLPLWSVFLSTVSFFAHTAKHSLKLKCKHEIIIIMIIIMCYHCWYFKNAGWFYLLMLVLGMSLYFCDQSEVSSLLTSHFSLDWADLELWQRRNQREQQVPGTMANGKAQKAVECRVEHGSFGTALWKQGLYEAHIGKWYIKYKLHVLSTKKRRKEVTLPKPYQSSGTYL